VKTLELTGMADIGVDPTGTNFSMEGNFASSYWSPSLPPSLDSWKQRACMAVMADLLTPWLSRDFGLSVCCNGDTDPFLALPVALAFASPCVFWGSPCRTPLVRNRRKFSATSSIRWAPGIAQDTCIHPTDLPL